MDAVRRQCELGSNFAYVNDKALELAEELVRISSQTTLTVTMTTLFSNFDAFSFFTFSILLRGAVEVISGTIIRFVSAGYWSVTRCLTIRVFLIIPSFKFAGINRKVTRKLNSLLLQYTEENQLTVMTRCFNFF